MMSEPRDCLVKLVAEYGTAALAAPLRLEGMLKDVCGEHRREIFVLVSCLRGGIVEQLRQEDPSSLKPASERLTHRLEQSLAIPGETARWAVESWAMALKLLPPSDGVGQAALPLQEEAAQAAHEESVPAESSRIDASDVPQAPEYLSAVYETVPLFAPGKGPEQPPEYVSQVPLPRRSVPDWSEADHQVTVYPDASPKKPSLREALRDARPKTCLVLKPGIYRDGIVIKKDLQIRGEGDPQDIVFEVISSSAIVLDGACLFLAGVTIRGASGKDQKAVTAIEVRSGHLTMEDCDLSNTAANIMEAKGEDAEMVLRGCHFHDGKASGISLQDGAHAYLEECQFYHNKLSHVVIGPRCTPTLFSCKFSHALMSGIYVNEEGGGLIENCDIWNNSMAGVQCRRGGNPRVRHCRISGGERYGILLAEQGEGSFEHCLIFANAKAGVTLGQQSRGTFSDCRISENGADGVDIAELSKGEFADCEIVGNGGPNVLLRDSADPRFIRTVIHEGKNEGVRVTSGAKGHFEQCEISSNAKAGASLSLNARPIFQTCFFQHGKESAITVSQGAEGHFIECEITDHAGTAVVTNDRSQPQFERCHISKNLAVGVQTGGTSAPTFQNCAISHNGAAGFLCAGSATPHMTAGEICENKEAGVVVSGQGKGRWENVHFIANGDGMLVSGEGAPTLKECLIEQSRGVGLRFREQAQGTIDEVEIIGSAGPGVEIDAGTTPVLRQVRVLKGKGVGILVHAQGGGGAEKCEVRDNAGGDWEIAATALFARAD